MNKLPQFKPRNLSRHQYGMLKFISENHVTRAYLRHAHGGTLWSVLYQRWAIATGPGKDDDPIVLTKDGQAELDAYQRASMPERSHEAELTERCQRLLKHSKRIVAMQKTA